MSQITKKVESMSLSSIGEVYLVSKILATIQPEQPVYIQALTRANRRLREYSETVKTLYTDYVYFHLADVVRFWINGHMKEVGYGEISVDDDGRVLFFDPATGENFDVTDRIPSIMTVLNQEYFLNLPEDEHRASSILYDMINFPEKAQKLYFSEFKQDEMKEVLDRIKSHLSHKVLRSLPKRLGKEELLKVFAKSQSMTNLVPFKLVKCWKSMVMLGKDQRVEDMADCIDSIIGEKEFKAFADAENDVSQQELLYIQEKVERGDPDVLRELLHTYTNTGI